MATDPESQRDIELSSLEAIYPEIQHPVPDNPYTFVLALPITPPKPVTVFSRRPDSDLASQAHTDAGHSQEVVHLPALRLEVSLGPNYPETEPPKVTISAQPAWVPQDKLSQLEAEVSNLWESLGRDMVVFSFIDHVQQAADEVFGLINEKGVLEVDSGLMIALLDYDFEARRAAFAKETFDCGICLEPKKGSVCHRMLDCGHVFCVQCLQDFYNAAIKEGDIAAVRCLEPGCAKERANAVSDKRRKKQAESVSPSELLQIPLDKDVVKRYVDLKYKIALETDKNTVYCPRSWCNGAARSKRHKKPQGLELPEASDDEDNEESEEDDERLAICVDCNFAFCKRCKKSWHGPFVYCKRTVEEKNQGQTIEDLATLEYIRRYTSPCPSCDAPVQKTAGCNHMRCSRCDTHFCYLCSAWLEPSNPYRHFNGGSPYCTGRLWELEAGQEAWDVDIERDLQGGPATDPNRDPFATHVFNYDQPEQRAAALDDARFDMRAAIMDFVGFDDDEVLGMQAALVPPAEQPAAAGAQQQDEAEQAHGLPEDPGQLRLRPTQSGVLLLRLLLLRGEENEDGDRLIDLLAEVAQPLVSDEQQQQDREEEGIIIGPLVEEEQMLRGVDVQELELPVVAELGLFLIIKDIT
ncbi:uncharacterized protein CTHT_0065370 [Thermochaetoides thermophila DSM 1495]|uniref:RBR-type E3 ubiquitin transferase n=1 Tax=Chaetomium thermophilum (strain DSM 1495 / CBS 144.50 / IMI 039719) TaxID=759272 RepID=G0SG80_CHATD|nr:hypothetical protein CTHT_0065370 [Thermochaetoides thermophila DSM 1495]EGS17219.1 hypothetical protein CTHT_0065370 [Thermochaetoides thermophila DSM 1495]